MISERGYLLCQTHSKVDYCYTLEEGELEYYLFDELTEEKTVLFSTQKKGMIVGWEAMNQPERFITNVVVKSTQATLIKVSKDTFLSDLTTEKLVSICKSIYHLFEQSLRRQTELLSNSVRQTAMNLENYYISSDSSLEERIQLLESSPFFGEFEESHLKRLAELMQRREYDPNELIYEQGDAAGGVFVLINGEVTIRRQAGERYIDLRSISTPGYIFGWSSTFNERDNCRASTEIKTSVYLIPTEELNSLIEEISFGIEFYKMVVWLMSNQLQLSYSRFIHLLDDHDLISVKHLIDINRPKIPLPSPLHQIPHLLKDLSTKSMAFSVLHKLNKNGTKQERHLSSLCLDLLKRDEKEELFISSLANVYTVVSNGTSGNPKFNRKNCSKQIRSAFNYVSFQLDGVENLPPESGNIFIYNHLVNHPRYTLNNRFQITLDSHFLSSLILDQYYDDPGMRTVRYGKSFEFGHQDYYDNLGYINVYTKDSDLKDDESKRSAKNEFYEQACQYLSDGTNFIISPEGTSFSSEESPGPFKMGPFNLAMKAGVEPFIVPVVFVNFDKRITEKPFYCKVHKPFKISERLEEGQSLKDFVESYQKEFSGLVEDGRLYAEKLFKEMNRQ